MKYKDYEVSVKDRPGVLRVWWKRMVCMVFCRCKSCTKAHGPQGAPMTLPDYERHGGIVSAKKWKASVRVMLKGGGSIPVERCKMLKFGKGLMGIARDTSLDNPQKSPRVSTPRGEPSSSAATVWSEPPKGLPPRPATTTWVPLPKAAPQPSKPGPSFPTGLPSPKTKPGGSSSTPHSLRQQGRGPEVFGILGKSSALERELRMLRKKKSGQKEGLRNRNPLAIVEAESRRVLAEQAKEEALAMREAQRARAIVAAEAKHSAAAASESEKVTAAKGAPSKLELPQEKAEMTHKRKLKDLLTKGKKRNLLGKEGGPASVKKVKKREKTEGEAPALAMSLVGVAGLKKKKEKGGSSLASTKKKKGKDAPPLVKLKNEEEAPSLLKKTKKNKDTGTSSLVKKRKKTVVAAIDLVGLPLVEGEGSGKTGVASKPQAKKRKKRKMLKDLEDVPARGSTAPPTSSMGEEVRQVSGVKRRLKVAGMMTQDSTRLGGSVSFVGVRKLEDGQLQYEGQTTSGKATEKYSSKPKGAKSRGRSPKVDMASIDRAVCNPAGPVPQEGQSPSVRTHFKEGERPEVLAPNCSGRGPPLVPPGWEWRTGLRPCDLYVASPDGVIIRSRRRLEEYLSGIANPPPYCDFKFFLVPRWKSEGGAGGKGRADLVREGVHVIEGGGDVIKGASNIALEGTRKAVGPEEFHLRGARRSAMEVGQNPASTAAAPVRPRANVDLSPGTWAAKNFAAAAAAFHPASAATPADYAAVASVASEHREGLGSLDDGEEVRSRGALRWAGRVTCSCGREECEWLRTADFDEDEWEEELEMELAGRSIVPVSETLAPSTTPPGGTSEEVEEWRRLTTSAVGSMGEALDRRREWRQQAIGLKTKKVEACRKLLEDAMRKAQVARQEAAAARQAAEAAIWNQPWGQPAGGKSGRGALPPNGDPGSGRSDSGSDTSRRGNGRPWEVVMGGREGGLRGQENGVAGNAGEGGDCSGWDREVDTALDQAVAIRTAALAREREETEAKQQLAAAVAEEGRLKMAEESKQLQQELDAARHLATQAELVCLFELESRMLRHDKLTKAQVLECTAKRDTYRAQLQASFKAIKRCQEA